MAKNTFAFASTGEHRDVQAIRTHATMQWVGAHHLVVAAACPAIARRRPHFYQTNALEMSCPAYRSRREKVSTAPPSTTSGYSSAQTTIAAAGGA